MWGVCLKKGNGEGAGRASNIPQENVSVGKQEGSLGASSFSQAKGCSVLEK